MARYKSRRTSAADPIINEESAKQISDLRARLKLTQYDFAKYLGVPVTTALKWENGTRTPGSSAQRLIYVLGLIELVAPDVHAYLLSENAKGGKPRPKVKAKATAKAMPKVPFPEVT